MSFLEMSLMGSAMILCILLLRMLSRSRLPGIVLSAMWAAALLRLLIPVEIPSVLSIAGLVKRSGQTTGMALPAQTWTDTMPISPLVIIWLCGAALCALFFLLVGMKQRRVLKTALPAVMTPELRAALHDQHLSREVAIFTSDRISTPMTYGLLKPRIVLPSPMKLYGQELKFVIAHECGHILRFDTAIKGVLLFAVCLHWFNPLVWLMAALCRRDMEINCDRRVLKAFGTNARALYAKTLLGLEERKRFSGMLMGCFSVSPLETRIRSIMAGKKSSFASTLAAIAAFGCAAAVFSTSQGSMPYVTTGSVQITTVPMSLYDTRQLNTTETAVYIMSGDVLTAAQPGLRLAAPYITVSGQLSRSTPAQTATSVSVKYGDVLAVVAENAAGPAVAAPVYGMTYTLSDNGIQH
jgi:beta-lactamase regulating signal transducer with metallopeptidase domain